MKLKVRKDYGPREIRREYGIRQTTWADSGNGMERFIVSEFYPEKSEPTKVHRTIHNGRNGNVMCATCQKDEWDKRWLGDANCAHSALVKTFRRQHCPEMWLYFVTFGQRVGYWKDGKQILLSKVSQVNRT